LNTDQLLNWDQEHLVHSRCIIGQNNGIIMNNSHGIYFQDTEGKEYIDGASQLLCVNLGYGNREIIDATLEEMQKLSYGMLFHGFSNTPIIECAQKLSVLVPSGLDHYNFTTGGSESIDIALRLARLYWHTRGKTKYKIISLYDSYHGVAFGGLNASGSGRGAYERGMTPLMQGFIHIPSYYCYRCSFGLGYPDCKMRCANYLSEVIEKEGADSIAAFIAEPELGVGGMIAPPPEYWPMVRDICNKYDILLIVDEVMTGFCRTGKMFASEHWGLRPDIMAMAKGLTSAYLPFGAVAFSQEIWDTLKGKNFVSYTYSGHPVCAAAAIKTMEIYLRDKIADHVMKVSKYALERLKEDFEPLQHIGGISGLGLMLGIEIVANKTTKQPFSPKLNIMQKLQNQALEKGLFLRMADMAGTPSDRIVFAPPLIITTQEIDKALDILLPLVADLKLEE
jgi:putrescine---pyruvate transaminase